VASQTDHRILANALDADSETTHKEAASVKPQTAGYFDLIHPRKKCVNAQCDRTVSAGATYCCHGRETEASAPARYWPSHTPKCNERTRGRGEGGNGA
jgi:hypothetical protein